MEEAFETFRQLLRQKRYSEAARLAESQVQASPADPFWHTQQAVALLRAGDAGHALAAARKALALDPSNPYAVTATADCLLAQDKTEEALSHFKEASSFPKVTARARRGMLDCLCRLERWGEALSLVAEWALPAEEGAPWKVKALAGLGRQEEAIGECRAWLERVPDHPPALWALTGLEVRRDGIEPVIERLGRTVKIPSLPPVYREIYASLCRKAGRPEAALKEYEKLEAQGTGTRAQRQQAFILARSGKESEALPLLEELLRASPADIYLHSSYESACKRIGQVERAINFYNTLLSAHPQARTLYGRIKNLKRALEKAE